MLRMNTISCHWYGPKKCVPFFSLFFALVWPRIDFIVDCWSISFDYRHFSDISWIFSKFYLVELKNFYRSNRKVCCAFVSFTVFNNIIVSSSLHTQCFYLVVLLFPMVLSVCALTIPVPMMCMWLNVAISYVFDETLLVSAVLASFTVKLATFYSIHSISSIWN